MDDLKKQVSEVEIRLNSALAQLKVAEKELEFAERQRQSKEPDFYRNPAAPKRLATLQNELKPWRKMQTDLQNVKEVLDLAGAEDMKNELQDQLNDIIESLEAQKDQLKLSGPYDDHDAIVSLYAGAGGTDAQDWTQMLFRMYRRYFE